jgi:predicted ATP-binding protein involved in virulence
MNITKIIIDGIRCFDHISFDLSPDQTTQKWNLILGDNGVGKTTVLRSIAMSLMDSTSASALLSELYGEWVRGKSKEPRTGIIYVEFDKKDSSGNNWFIKTTFERTKTGSDKVSQETLPKEFPSNKIFVCGYGAARRAYGTKDYSVYTSIDSTYTLFNYDAPLQSPELILRRLSSIDAKLEEILTWIDEILMLPKGSTKLNFRGITVDGPWGQLMPYGALGDGYQATIAWIIDMLGWVMYFDRGIFKNGREKLSGIVLLDEIEQHLHPKWQKQIIDLLHKKFPKFQFIATTHSPLCAIGTSNLEDENCGLFLLEQKDESVAVSDRFKPPRGKRADQVLTSYLFGMQTTRSDDTIEFLERFSVLLAKKARSKEENQEVESLRSRLNEEFGSAETKLQQLVKKAVDKALDKLTTEALQVKELPSEAIDFEVKRQLRKLFNYGDHE